MRPCATIVAAVACGLLAGCGSLPDRGETVTVAVRAVLTPQALKAAERARLAAAGVDDAAIAAGRLLSVHCSIGADGWWDSLALLPPGLRAERGSALRLTVTDPGTNDRLGLNPASGPVTPDPFSGRLAHTFVPDWRERGRSSNIDPVPLPDAQRGRYHVVQGSFLLRCRG